MLFKTYECLGMYPKVHTPNGNNGQHHPGRPFWHVFNKDQGHQSRNKYQVSLLESQWSTPVNAHQTGNTKVPHYQQSSWIVHRNVVRSKQFPFRRTTKKRR